MDIRIINLERGLPIVAEAMGNLEWQIDIMKSNKEKHALIIHGYGKMTHGGGKIKSACRTKLKRLVSEGEIKRVVLGEDLSIFSTFGSQLLLKYENVREYLTGRNIGIVAIEI